MKRLRFNARFDTLHFGLPFAVSELRALYFVSLQISIFCVHFTLTIFDTDKINEAVKYLNASSNKE